MGGVAAAMRGCASATSGARSEPLRRRLPSRLRGEVAERSTSRALVDALSDEFRRSYRSTLWADVTANIIRNFWSNAIIFCGRFPDQTYSFSEEEVADENKGAWYVRQLLGAANIEGGGFFHVASGDLGYQVEHHLFPDMPSTRYGEIAPKVKDVCERYGLPYNTGPFAQQWLMVQRTHPAARLPGRKAAAQAGPLPGHRHRGRARGARQRQRRLAGSELERQLALQAGADRERPGGGSEQASSVPSMRKRGVIAGSVAACLMLAPAAGTQAPKPGALVEKKVRSAAPYRQAGARVAGPCL